MLIDFVLDTDSRVAVLQQLGRRIGTSFVALFLRFYWQYLGKCSWNGGSHEGQLSGHASVLSGFLLVSLVVLLSRAIPIYTCHSPLDQLQSISLYHLLLSTSNVCPRYACPIHKKALSFLAWRYTSCHGQKLVTNPRLQA